jgi:HSP20 family protein
MIIFNHGGEVMNLITRDPLLGSLFEDFYESRKQNYIMKSDIYEKDGKYVIETDIPGFKKDDVSIDYDDGYITITAKKEEVIEDDTNYIRRERHYGESTRSYYVGNINENEINAKFENGTLKIMVPKEEIKSSVKQIPIE